MCDSPKLKRHPGLILPHAEGAQSHPVNSTLDGFGTKSIEVQPIQAALFRIGLVVLRHPHIFTLQWGSWHISTCFYHLNSKLASISVGAACLMEIPPRDLWGREAGIALKKNWFDFFIRLWNLLWQLELMRLVQLKLKNLGIPDRMASRKGFSLPPTERRGGRRPSHDMGSGPNEHCNRLPQEHCYLFLGIKNMLTGIPLSLLYLVALPCWGLKCGVSAFKRLVKKYTRSRGFWRDPVPSWAPTRRHCGSSTHHPLWFQWLFSGQFQLRSNTTRVLPTHSRRDWPAETSPVATYEASSLPWKVCCRYCKQYIPAALHDTCLT